MFPFKTLSKNWWQKFDPKYIVINYWMLLKWWYIIITRHFSSSNMPKKLNYVLMKKDRIWILIGATLARLFFVNTIIIIFTDDDFWWIDPTVAIITGVVRFIISLYRIMKLYSDGYQHCSTRWLVSNNRSKTRRISKSYAQYANKMTTVITMRKKKISIY